MCSLVHGKCALLFESMCTSWKFALPRLFASVCPHVLIERLLCGELQATNRAFNRFISCVSLNMAFQFALLTKNICPGAAMPLTAKPRTLSRHIFQMVILCVRMQVVCIFKTHSTDFVTSHLPLADAIGSSLCVCNCGRNWRYYG